MATRATHHLRVQDEKPWHYNGPNRTFGALLRELRMKRFISRAMLAAKSGVSQPHLAALEDNQAVPSINDIKRLSPVLGVASDQLLAMAGYTKPEVEQKP